MSKATFLSVTALIPAGASLDDDLKFYKEQMGFSEVWRAGNMGGVARDGVAFNLIQNTNQEWAGNSSFSIGVSDLDALYEEYRGMAAARVGPLEMKFWGRREFHIVVPSGVCLQFYASLA